MALRRLLPLLIVLADVRALSSDTRAMRVTRPTLQGSSLGAAPGAALDAARPTRRGLLLAGAAGLASSLAVERASAVEATAQQKEEIAKALEKAVQETAAASAAGAKVASEFFEDPQTQKLLKDASETATKVAADAGAAAGAAAWDLAKGIKDGTVQQSASNTADVLSLPARIAAVAATDGGDLAKAIDEWSQLPGVRELSATSGKSASALSAAALSSANAALDDVKKRAKSGELAEDAKNVGRVAGDVSKTLGLDSAATGVAKAVGDATVDVVAAAIDGDASRLDKAASTVAAAFRLATEKAPVASGFVAGVVLSWLAGLGKDARIEAQSREIASLKKNLADVTGLKNLVGLGTD